jgi:hypothetical protein
MYTIRYKCMMCINNTSNSKNEGDGVCKMNKGGGRGDCKTETMRIAYFYI